MRAGCGTGHYTGLVRMRPLSSRDDGYRRGLSGVFAGPADAAVAGVVQARAQCRSGIRGQAEGEADVVAMQDLAQAGAGGLVRAYTDSVAQALLQARKVPIIKLAHLRCTAPYAFEGLVRRELDAAGARLDAVAHGDEVLFDFSLPAQDAGALRIRLDNAGHGRIAWPTSDEECAADT